MTDPLSPEERQELIDAPHYVDGWQVTDAQAQRLLDIATDHARLHEARDDNGQWAIEVRRQLMRVGQSQAPFIDDAVRDLVDEVLTAREQNTKLYTEFAVARSENAKLRERVEKLEAVVSVARERKRACDCLPESGCVAARFDAALAALDEKPTP